MKKINEEMAVLMTIDMINDCEPEVKVAGMAMEPGAVLKRMDPVAFRETMLNYMDDIGYEVI